MSTKISWILLSFFFQCLVIISPAQQTSFFSDSRLTWNESEGSNHLIPFVFHPAKAHTFTIPNQLMPALAVPLITSKVTYPAFFCRLENRMDKDFNLRLKFRAGNADLYRKLSRCSLP